MQEPGPPQRLIELAPQDELSRRASGASLLVLAIGVLGWSFVCAGSSVLTDFFTNPGLAVVSALGAAAFGVPYLLVVLWMDRNEKEPLYLILTAMAWGALVATGGSLVLSGVVGDALVGMSIAEGLDISPAVEELSKGLALFALYALFRHHLDNVLDGVIYGALVGLGFAVFENFVYYMETGEIGTAVALICLRGLITAPGSHACFTAITGASLGLFRVQRHPARWLIPALGLAAAMGTHFGWNLLYAQVAGAFGSDLGSFLLRLPVAVVALQLPFVALVLLVAGFALRHETTLITTYLGTEAPPVLHPVELDYLIPARRRSLRSLLLVMQGRTQEYFLVRHRNELLVALAFTRWHRDNEQDEIEAAALDARAATLRAELTALPAPPP